MHLNKEEKDLFELLQSLKSKLDEYTLTNYKRINPFTENLVDWKNKGEKIFKNKNITVYDTSTIVGDVDVGENTWIGPYTALDGTGGLKIGKNCSISSKVNIISHDSVKWALSGGSAQYEYAPISIGDNCFVGTGAFVGKGVTIGNNCLIAANSVVTKNFDDFSIIGGTPAKKIGHVVVKKNEEVELIFKNESKAKK